MRIAILVISLLFCTHLKAQDLQEEPFRHEPLVDLEIEEKNRKVNECIDEYLGRNPKSYSRIIKNRLYELLDDVGNTFKGSREDVPFKERLEALAKVQCELYYNINLLKD